MRPTSPVRTLSRNSIDAMDSTSLGAIIQVRLAQIERLIRKWEILTGFPHDDLPTLVRLKMISYDNPYQALYAQRNLRIRPRYLAAGVIATWIVGVTMMWLATR